MSTKMGFEGEIYYGAAGSTAATKITNSQDISVSIDPEKAGTTVRGDGSSPPINTERVVALGSQYEWTMLNKTTDAVLAALRAAVATGAAVALRSKDYSAGKGFDGDVTLAMKNGQPIKGEQTFVFTATPTDEGGRAPSLYV
jgi:hypothetical protein